MNKITSKGQITMMYVFTSLVYFMSYTTRVNYNTILVEISSAENISRSLLALPLTASFITYGFGQIISGWLGDKFDAFKVVSAGLFLSAFMNILLPLYPKPYAMVIFWAVNGFAQALIYPPLVKIIAHYLSEKKYENACLFVTIASHAATLLLYIISPVIISLLGWRFVFIFSFVCVTVFLVAWQIYSARVKKRYGMPQEHPQKQDKTYNTEHNISFYSLFISSGLLLIMTAVVMMGFMRDGITTWMPAYLSDIFSLSNEMSILTTVILPMFSILSSYVILIIQRHFCKNELKLAAIVFITALLPISVLICFRGNIALSVLSLALTSACAHAVNFLLICIVPMRFEKLGRISFVTGLLNACTYVGAAISIYTIAAVSESRGWTFVLILWGIVALTGCISCFAALRKRKD